MKLYTFKFEQLMPRGLNETWDFFSSPLNLSRITPDHMGFIITSEVDTHYKMYPGLIISYKVSPLPGIRLNWVTEITHVKEKEYFIDEQRFGPFALWHHEHHFKEVNEGVLMKDSLTYALPYGPAGRLINTLIVSKNIKDIFLFRERRINELFPKPA